MLNVSEHFLEEVRVALAYVKESARVILHTILVQRSIGGQQAVDVRTVWSEQLELAYCRLEDLELQDLVETKVKEFVDMFEKNQNQKRSGCLSLHFYTTKSKKASVWNLLLGQEEKIVFETWRIPLTLQNLRRYTHPEDELLQEANLQRTAAQYVRLTVEECVRKVMTSNMDHLPPPPQHLPVYRFEIAFDSGAPFSPRAFSQAIKIPYIS
ncbi:unnamed protein product [Amoebophrya sp. A120]|nr:unnamed protein product [Amoebophrya sp. A120]|eukprot:GSA120T00018553001.1